MYAHTYKNRGLAHKHENYLLKLEIMPHCFRISDSSFRYQHIVEKGPNSKQAKGCVYQRLMAAPH